MEWSIFANGHRNSRTNTSAHINAMEIMHNILMLMGRITITNYLFPMLPASHVAIFIFIFVNFHAHRQMIAIYYCSKCWWCLSFMHIPIQWLHSHALKHWRRSLYTNDAFKYRNRALALHAREEGKKIYIQRKQNHIPTNECIAFNRNRTKVVGILTGISFPLERIKTKTCVRNRQRTRDLMRCDACETIYGRKRFDPIESQWLQP